MIKFVIGQSKRITIQRLTSEPVNENWKYQWYACKTRKCDDIDIFYSVTDRNGNNVLNEWISDSFVDYNFFEITSTDESFWIFVNVDKNDGCDICLYELQIKVNDGLEPEIEVDLSELDCLDINASLENELIVGKVFAKNTPKLQQIRLSVPLNNSIEFSSSNKLLFNTNLIEVSDVDDIIEYKFEFRINIINHGAGSIKTSFISQEGITLSETITYNFFIIPNLFKLFNLNTTIYEIKTTLPFTCSSNIIGQNDTNAPEVFINDETITTILDLRLFGTFLSEFEFIYSVAKVFSPNFCYSNDINLIPNSAFEEVIKIKGSETNGISYKFIATLSSQQLNYLPRPFTIVVRLEVRKIKDIYCSNLGNNTANLRGWTILPASTICDTIIPHKNPSLSNPPEYKWCDCCKDCGDDPICLSKCASNPENYKFLVEASIPCESICFHNCECWDSLGIDPDISMDRHYYNLHITSECNEPYHKDCPECFRYCLDCSKNCGGHNDCVGDCYRGEYRQCVDNCEDDLNCIEECKKEYYLVPCKNYQHNCDNLPCEKECPGEEERIPCEQECCTKPCPCPTGCINYLEGKEIPCTSECPSCMQVCSCGETDIPCGEACPSCKWCILSCCGLEVARFKNRIPSNSEIDFLINNDRRCRTWNCTNITLKCVTNPPPPLKYDLICCDEKVDSFEWIGNVLTCQEYIGYEDCNTIICDNNGNCEKICVCCSDKREVLRMQFKQGDIIPQCLFNLCDGINCEEPPAKYCICDGVLTEFVSGECPCEEESEQPDECFEGYKWCSCCGELTRVCISEPCPYCEIPDCECKCGGESEADELGKTHKCINSHNIEKCPCPEIEDCPLDVDNLTYECWQCKYNTENHYGVWEKVTQTLDCHEKMPCNNFTAMCLTRGIIRCGTNCSEEFSCENCVEDFKFPIIPNFGNFDYSITPKDVSDIAFSKHFVTVEHPSEVCGDETRCVIKMNDIERDLMYVLGIKVDGNAEQFEWNGEIFENYPLDITTFDGGWGAIYKDVGVWKNDYEYLSPVEYAGYDFLSDVRNSVDNYGKNVGMNRRDEFQIYWEYNGGKGLEECDYGMPCPRKYQEEFMSFISDHPDLFDINEVKDLSFEEFVCSTQYLSLNMREFLYDKLRDMVYSLGAVPQDSNPTNEPLCVLEPYDVLNPVHNNYYEAMCDLMPNEVPRTENIGYKAVYDIENNYIQFEVNHLSGERINGYENIFTNQKIQIKDENGNVIPNMTFGDGVSNISVDVKLLFKQNFNTIIFEIIANSQIQQFVINRGENKLFSIESFSTTSTTLEAFITIEVQTDGIIDFSVNSESWVSRFVWQLDEKYFDCDFNQEGVILKENGIIPNRRLHSINYQISDIYLERPLNILAMYLQITKIPDWFCNSPTCNPAPNCNGLSQWCIHPVFAARSFIRRYNEFKTSTGYSGSIYDYLIMIYICGDDVYDNLGSINPIENRNDAILLKVFKLEKQREYLRNLLDLYLEYWKPFRRDNETLECRYREDGLVYEAPLEGGRANKSGESYDYWKWEMYNECTDYGFSGDCEECVEQCLNCNQSEYEFIGELSDPGHRFSPFGVGDLNIGGINTHNFNQWQTLRQCGIIKEELSNEPCEKCKNCFKDIEWRDIVTYHPNDDNIYRSIMNSALTDVSTHSNFNGINWNDTERIWERWREDNCRFACQNGCSCGECDSAGFKWSHIYISETLLNTFLPLNGSSSNDYVTNSSEGGIINMHLVVAEINQMVIDNDPLVDGVIFPEIIAGEYPQLACWQFEGGCPNEGDESTCKCRTATCEIEHKWIGCCEELRDPLCSIFNETIVNVIVEIYDKEGILSEDEPLDVVEITGKSGETFMQLGENEVLCEQDLTVGYKRFNDCYRLLESYHTFNKLEIPSIPTQLMPEAPGTESIERGYKFPYFVSNEEETHYGEVIFKFERVPVSVEIIVNIVNSMVHEKLPVNVIESDNSLSITTFNGNNINEINDLRCGLDYTIEFEKLNCYEFVDSSNDLGLIIPDDLGKFVFPAPNKNGIIEFNYKLKEVVVTIIFEFEDDFEHCGTDENITNIKDVVIITGFITNVLDEQENWELDSYDESSVTYIKTNVGCGNEVQVGFDIDCNCYEFVDSISDNFGIDGGLENGLENYIFKPFEDGIIVFKFKRKEINIKIEIIRGDE